MAREKAWLEQAAVELVAALLGVEMIYARILIDDCKDCREQLVMACRDGGLPLPATPIFAVPDGWIDCECPHKWYGFVLEEVDPQLSGMNLTEGDYETPEDVEVGEVEGPDGWLNLDATKNWGYSAREQGKYGSHPTHDDFDDESEP